MQKFKQITPGDLSEMRIGGVNVEEIKTIFGKPESTSTGKFKG